jgi:hypothetical protein
MAQTLALADYLETSVNDLQNRIVQKVDSLKARVESGDFYVKDVAEVLSDSGEDLAFFSQTQAVLTRRLREGGTEADMLRSMRRYLLSVPQFNMPSSTQANWNLVMRMVTD